MFSFLLAINIANGGWVPCELEAQFHAQDDRPTPAVILLYPQPCQHLLNNGGEKSKK